MGSSYIGDGVGRQLWNFRDGTLHGDRPLSLKLYGYYILNWNATVGAYAIVQSGQPWEKWDYVPYLNLSTSTTEMSKYGEPAGSRRTPTHYQLDLNYTQNFRFKGRYSVQRLGRLVQRVQQADRVQLQPVFPQHAVQYAAQLHGSAAPADRGAVPVLEGPGGSGLKAQGLGLRHRPQSRGPVADAAGLFACAAALGSGLSALALATERAFPSR